jgi:predicted Zn-ribbon and HTH transcriptional regulator
MEGLWLILGLVAVIAIIAFAVKSHFNEAGKFQSSRAELIECRNCGKRFSRGKFIQARGCPSCGADYIDG